MNRFFAFTFLLPIASIAMENTQDLQEELTKDFRDKKQWIKRSETACTALHQLIIEGDLEAQCMYDIATYRSATRETTYEWPAIKSTFRELRKDCTYEIPVAALISRDDEAARANELCSSMELFNTICANPQVLAGYKGLKEKKKSPEEFMAAFDTSFVKTFTERGIAIPLTGITKPSENSIRMLVAANQTLRLADNQEYYKKLAVAGMLIGLHMVTFGQERNQAEETLSKINALRALRIKSFQSPDCNIV